MLGTLIAFSCLWIIITLLQGPFQPKALRYQHRQLKLWMLEASLLAIPFLLMILVTQRILLASLTTLALFVTPIIVNLAKYRALREPLVFSDFYLYIQVFTHPRLFLPFLNIPLTIAAIGSGALALILIILFESTTRLPSIPTLGIITLALIFIWKNSENYTPKHLAIDDVRRFGLYNSLLISSLQAVKENRKQNMYQRILNNSPFQYLQTHSANQPDLLVIQSESFCDIRSLHPSIKADVLKHYDRICQQARTHGPLTVPAWGANTLRTEFAFLSGIDNAQLLHYRYNPYQFITRPMPTLANQLKQQGYHTICVHPNHAEFFKRNKVYPLLGFDEFIDIHDFSDAHRDGPYISDQAVTDKLISLLNNRPSDKPLFIFVITMENHGPLHLETYQPKDVETFYSDTPPQQHHDLTIYLKHLNNADQMLNRITEYLSNSAIEAHLCWYGDHVPSMPAVYDELGVQHLDSHYLIWNNRMTQPNLGSKASSQHGSIEDLGIKLLRDVTLTPN